MVINIEKISISVYEAFNGLQPVLSVGDENDNQRYVQNISISKQGVYVYELDTDGITTNHELDINVYVKNASISGNILVTMDYKFTPEYYSDIFASVKTDSNSVNVVDLFDNDFEIEIDQEVDKNNKGFEEVVLSANSKAFREEFRYVKQKKKLVRENFNYKR